MAEFEVLLAPILKAGGGGAIIVALLYLARHVLPSSTERIGVGQRRIESDAVRAQKWEVEWKECEARRDAEQKEREQKQRQLDRLSWFYDDVILLAGSETPAESVKKQIAARPKAQQVCEAVK